MPRSFRRLRLHRRRVEAVGGVPRGLYQMGRYSRDSVTLEEDVDFERDLVLQRLVAEVLAERLPDERVVESVVEEMLRPATWVDHFKLRFAGRWWVRWWVRWWPVRLVEVPHRLTVVVDLQRWRKFPEADLDFQQDWGRLGPPYMDAEVRLEARYEKGGPR